MHRSLREFDPRWNQTTHLHRRCFLTWPRLERSTSGKQTPAQPTPCSKTPSKNGHSAKAPIVDATILTVGTPTALARNLWLIHQADHRGQAVHPITAQIRASPVRSNRSTLR